MRVRVRLFGTLPAYYSGAYPDAGLDLDIPMNTSVAELVDFIKLPKEQVAIVAIDGMLAKGNQLVPDGAEVKLFQPLNGG
jgi:sulfur carrier protein ThiS